MRRLFAKLFGKGGVREQLRQEVEKRERAREELRLALRDLERRTEELAEANARLKRETAEHARTEARLASRANELARSNAELEQFAYVASHDLQEPLRKVAAFCQLLREEYGGKLGGDADLYINYAVDGALRMQRLVKDLLAYSRAGGRGIDPEPTDAAAACATAIMNLHDAIEAAGTAVTRDPLPPVMADRPHLIQLFQNLIGNAIKYRAKDRPSAVHVSARPWGDRWLFSVRDNGIGIAKQFHERVFVLFQRLHRPEEYSGTGIGLTICKKIVERLGGKIWVESAEGAGSTFQFTLPPAEPFTPTGARGNEPPSE